MSQTAAEMSGCQKLVNWFLCCKEDDLDFKQKGTNGVDTSAMELPGYLNRFNYDNQDKNSGKSWSGSDDDAVSATDSLKKFKGKGKLDGNSVASSDIIHSECDSGLGSASDSGRGRSGSQNGTSSNSDNSEKENSSDERSKEEIENIKRLQSLVRKSDNHVVIAQPITTYDKSKPKKHDSSSDESNKPEKSRRKPKRNESTLSRFSSIFGGNGRNLTDVLVEEFRLNDRFSGLSMDRIWGGFMDGIKEESEEPEVPETPETKAKRALNEKTKKRRRRRARNQAPQMATKNTKPIQAKSFKRQKSRKQWQQELPQDWQDVIAL